MPGEFHTFNVRASELRAALLFVGESEDELKLPQTGVHFEIRPNTLPLMIASDGARLCAIETCATQGMPPDFEYKLSLAGEFLKALCGFAKSQAESIGIQWHPQDRCVFHLAESNCVVDSEKGAVLSCKFPTWRNVVPHGPRNIVQNIGLNAAYVGDFAKAAKLLGLESGLIRLNLFEENGAIEIKLHGFESFYGVVMPLKATEEPIVWQPEFIALTTKPPVATTDPSPPF